MKYQTVRKTVASKKGPKTVLFAGIHGNEYGGIDAVKEMEFPASSGSIQSILCNMPAIEAKKRFVYRNLNHLFGRRHKFHNQSTYEFPLVSSLEKILQSSDFLLDIHNSNTPKSPLFLITEHLDIGKYFEVDYVCGGFDVIQPGGTDYFMNACLGKVGICLECGYLTDTPEAWLQEQIINFLRYTGNISGTAKTYKKQKYCHATLCYKTKNTFTAHKDFKDFEPIKQGGIIGYDGKRKIVASKDGFMLFVRSGCRSGKEAFIFGEFLPDFQS